MFVRIYVGIIVSLLLAAVGSYAMFTHINAKRLVHYNERLFSGTFKLILEGLGRHEGDKQDEWLAIVNRISGLEIQLHEFNSISLNREERQKLAQGIVIFRHNHNSDYFDVIGTVSNRENKLLVAHIQHFAEQQIRTAALLVINELSLYPQTLQKPQLLRLNRIFAFDLAISSINELDLDAIQRRRIAARGVIVSWQTDTSGRDQLMVYAALNDPSLALVLGPIENFNQTPGTLVAALIAFSLIITGSIAYLLVYRLETRLTRMNSVVEKLGPSDLSTRADVKGRDAIAKLALKLNNMAERIGSLLKEQKHITQAVSHDLRTPISRLKFRLDGLTNAEDLEDRSKQIAGMQRDIEELDRLVDEILLFHQLESSVVASNKHSEQLEERDIQRCFDQVIEQTSTLFPEKQVDIQVEQNDRVTIFPNHFNRLLQNLVSNALRYAKSNVKLSYYFEPTKYQIVVEDDGEGIAESLWPELFKPFARIESSRNKKLGGYGLGLAIVKRIADMHDGDISIANSSLGGAKFSFEWPR